jgi:hypothetical protein
MTDKTESSKRNPSRNLFYILLSTFLIVAILAIAAGAYLGLNIVRGAENVTNPVRDLIRQLVLEATPVILPNPVVIVEEINSLARLETTSYSFQDILQIERNRELLFGIFGEEILFVAFGNVIAGVDLSKMGPEDLQVVSPTRAIVRLPEAEIFLTDLDNERSYVANRDIGLLTKGDPDLETKIRQEAEARMLEAALSHGILERANNEARNFMTAFLGQLGFSEVEFVAGEFPPTTPFSQTLPKGFMLTPAPETTPIAP